ncbi:MAG: hypothetical protein QME81_17090, partial [bacterium]|nr:hypothetical protein [bacterium]
SGSRFKVQGSRFKVQGWSLRVLRTVRLSSLVHRFGQEWIPKLVAATFRLRDISQAKACAYRLIFLESPNGRNDGQGRLSDKFDPLFARDAEGVGLVFTPTPKG